MEAKNYDDVSGRVCLIVAINLWCVVKLVETTPISRNSVCCCGVESTVYACHVHIYSLGRALDF